MKKFGKIFGISLLCLSPFFYTQTNAAASVQVARSGVSLTNSTIHIKYDSRILISAPSNYNYTERGEFSCFGTTTTTNENDGTAYKTADLTTNFAAINALFEDGNTDKSEQINRKPETSDSISAPDPKIKLLINNATGSSSLNDCFKAAGSYTVDIQLQDAVGNKSDSDDNNSGDQPYQFAFTIKPGDVATAITEVDTTTPLNCNNAFANGLDTCQLSTKLRDYAGNIVYQITNASRTISSNSSYPTDFPAFSTGLLNGGDNGNRGTIITGPISGILSSPGRDRLSLQSLIPTLASDGLTESAKEINITYSNIPTITNAGNIGTETNIITNGSTANNNESPVVTFKRPILVDVETQAGVLSGGNNEYQLDATAFTPAIANFKDGTQRLKITASPSIEAPIPGSQSVSTILEGTSDVIYSRQISENVSKEIGNKLSSDNIEPFNFNAATSLDIESEQEIDSIMTSIIGVQQNVINVTSDAIEYLTNFFPANGAEGLTPDFNLKTLIEYVVDVDGTNNLTVKYYAGSNDSSTTSNALGVLIESNVITRDSEKKILANDLAVLTGLAQKDVRETITRNAFALARTAPNKRHSNFNLNSVSDFNLGDVLIVQRKRTSDPQPNVKIGGQLPSGKKTLVIIDGNLLIDNNTFYGDEENDSFGVILINTNPEKMPNTGNIFVKNNVNNIRGTFFADGGILPSNASNTGQIDDLSASEANVDNSLDHHDQLRIVGSILTRNTIGGAGKAGSETALQTPWGDTTEIDDAKRYDLLYTRDAIATPDNCTHATNYNSTTVGTCDDGTNEKAYSFILRFDRKVLEQSPPGFTTTQSVQQ